ncbi:hypothetical protein MCOR29_002061 [Pyricularia oryzae]|nr:hypothetical protein MCOR29_002061 [Pyricularia oryzae]KAI6573280.1 hypothetical protein MCOR09_002989 [Pyricularia oryzae]KAI6634000.1 hypothetical protein MCOR08_004817 [Pyricularia oryzae]
MKSPPKISELKPFAQSTQEWMYDDLIQVCLDMVCSFNKWGPRSSTALMAVDGDCGTSPRFRHTTPCPRDPSIPRHEPKFQLPQPLQAPVHLLEGTAASSLRLASPSLADQSLQKIIFAPRRSGAVHEPEGLHHQRLRRSSVPDRDITRSGMGGHSMRPWDPGGAQSVLEIIELVGWQGSWRRPRASADLLIVGPYKSSSLKSQFS